MVGRNLSLRDFFSTRLCRDWPRLDLVDGRPISPEINLIADDL